MPCFIDSFHIMDQRKEVKFKIGRVYPFFRNEIRRKVTIELFGSSVNSSMNYFFGMLKKKKITWFFFFLINICLFHSIFPSFLIIFNMNLGIHQKNQIHEMKEKELENRKTCLSIISDWLKSTQIKRRTKIKILYTLHIFNWYRHVWRYIL